MRLLLEDFEDRTKLVGKAESNATATNFCHLNIQRGLLGHEGTSKTANCAVGGPHLPVYRSLLLEYFYGATGKGHQQK